MAMIGYTTPNTLLSGNPEAAPDINELAENAIWLDMLSYRGRVPFADQVRLLNDNGGNPVVFSRCSFQYRTGLTTATFVLGTNIGTATLQIYMNGASVYSAALANGTSTVNVTISGLGYSDYQMIDVIVQAAVTWSGSNIFRLYDAFTTPYTAVMTTSWPGVPTFGAISVANNAQLASAQEWLMQRMNIVVQPLFFSQQYVSYSSWVNIDQMWSGGISKSNGCDRLRISVGYNVVTNQQERLLIYINDILVVTGPTWTTSQSGNYLFDIDISSYGDGTLFALRIMFECVVGALAGVKWHSSRYILGDIYTTKATPSPATAPTASSIRESLTFGTLQTRLNSIGTICTDVYNRINAATDTFNKVRMFRWLPAVDDGQRKYFSSLNAFLPYGRRAYDALWVRGKGLKLAYGARKVTASLDDSYVLEFPYNEELISGSELVQDELFYLDGFAGLFPGSPYFILGEDVRAAFAQLR